MEEKAQGLVEYGLILALVALVVISALRLTGTNISEVFARTANSFGIENGSPIEGMVGDFLGRIQQFYDENGRYPRSWGDYRFTDIGLDPADWADTVDGVLWNPNGDKVGLGNKIGDDIQVYVTDTDGNRLHLYDGWNIWCVGDGTCYYHTVAPGNEVDLSTIEIVQ
jgi:Flp pilus assembly pilin Flp